MNADWHVVRTCTWLHEALFLKSVLDAAGIEAIIPDEHTVSVQPLYAQALGGIRILVHADDLARAGDILASAEAPPGDFDDGESS
jgi:hypothetical protein